MSLKNLVNNHWVSQALSGWFAVLEAYDEALRPWRKTGASKVFSQYAIFCGRFEDAPEKFTHTKQHRTYFLLYLFFIIPQYPQEKSPKKLNLFAPEETFLKAACLLVNFNKVTFANRSEVNSYIFDFEKSGRRP